MITANDIIFRASQVGRLMGVKGLGKTGKTLAREEYIHTAYGRVKEFNSKYTKKGIQNEPTSLELLSQIDGVKYEKNNERRTDEYFTGECDVLIVDEKVKDVKNSWDIFTFFDAISEFNTDYEWQLRVYKRLYKVNKSELIYTLLDAPDSMVLDAIYRETFNHKEEVPEWRIVQIIQSMVFTTDAHERLISYNSGVMSCDIACRLIDNFIPIPIEKRIVRYNFIHEEDKINKAISRVKEAREYLKQTYKIN